MPPENLQKLHQQIYADGHLFGVDQVRPFPIAGGVRPNTIAVAGGAFGDEGKGRIVDEFCTLLARDAGQSGLVIYRWNGGANAGHTIIVDGQRVALHQLPAGALHEGATVILGKGMVIHPGDLAAEIDMLRAIMGTHRTLDLRIDPQAVLSLDTHRAYESALQDWESGGRGSTGRGISPAYADVLLRHPVRAGDLLHMNAGGRERLSRHYDLYEALTQGLGTALASCAVPSLTGSRIAVGSCEEFLERLAAQADSLRAYIRPDVHAFVARTWADERVPFVFEGAQGIGLDARWGVYPDVTASDPTFDGIAASSEGVILADHLHLRAGALKATYTSSVGTRRLPTHMDEPLAHRIREDAHEYGATTRRPRDIAYIDLPSLRFFAQVSRMNALILTHLDIAYPEVPIRVCTHYLDESGSTAAYRPDQAYLEQVTPAYIELPSWDGRAVQGARALSDLPLAALQYIAFLSQALGCPPAMATTGPEREAVIRWV